MRLSLGTKFTATVLIILVITMAANTAYFLGTSARFHEQQLKERGQALGRLVALISPEAMLALDFLRLNDYTREVASQPDVVYGVIVNPAGMAISSYVDDTDALIKQLFRPAESKDIPKVLKTLENRDEVIHLQFPITHNTETLGRFLVGISRQSL